MRILLVEDNRELSDWLGRLLRKSRYVVDCVHDGVDADAALSTQSFDLVILDIGLPQMPGIEVLKRFRAQRGLTPVIILTANDAITSRIAGLDKGVDVAQAHRGIFPDHARPRVISEIRYQRAFLCRHLAVGRSLALGVLLGHRFGFGLGFGFFLLHFGDAFGQRPDLGLQICNLVRPCGTRHHHRNDGDANHDGYPTSCGGTEDAGNFAGPCVKFRACA
jgi:CheY-like chemotaxis protein